MTPLNVPCPICDGKGWKYNKPITWVSPYSPVKAVECFNCKGSGKLYFEKTHKDAIGGIEWKKS